MPVKLAFDSLQAKKKKKKEKRVLNPHLYIKTVWLAGTVVGSEIQRSVTMV